MPIKHCEISVNFPVKPLSNTTQLMLQAIAKYIPSTTIKSTIAWVELCEFARPLRFVLHGIGLAVAALVLVFCVLLMQVVIRESFSLQVPRTGIVQLESRAAGKKLFRPRNHFDNLSWQEAQSENMRYLSQVRAQNQLTP